MKIELVITIKAAIFNISIKKNYQKSQLETKFIEIDQMRLKIQGQIKHIGIEFVWFSTDSPKQQGLF